MKFENILAVAVIVYGFVTLTYTLGCDGNKHKSKDIKVAEQPVNVHYQGLVNGCKAYYNPVYCPEWFKPGQLNAGEDIAVLVDENGSTIILNRKVLPKVLDVLKDK
jgi:hypothetical protein